jgi:hypothetical protein
MNNTRNITRVIQDGIEFFTVDDTGESGMSESGLARLCGVSTPAVIEVLRNLSTTLDNGESLESNQVKSFRFKLQPKDRTSRGHNSDLTFIRATACAKVIEYYALDSRRKTEEAMFAYRKFAAMGVNAWIQGITQWHGNPVPKNGIVIDSKTLETLLHSKFDASALRLFLYFQKAIRGRFIPSIEESLQGAGLSRSAYTAAIAKLEPYQLLPNWCKVQRRNQPERIVRDRLQAQLGGKTEAPTPWGPVDLLTDTEIIEVKALHLWKEAIGPLHLKSKCVPNHIKRLHLYGPSDLNLNKIAQECQELNIQVTFEKTTKEELIQQSKQKDPTHSDENSLEVANLT